MRKIDKGDEVYTFSDKKSVMHRNIELYCTETNVTLCYYYFLKKNFKCFGLGNNIKCHEYF